MAENGTDLRTLFQEVLATTQREWEKKQGIEEMLETILEGVSAIAERPHSERDEDRRLLATIQEEVRGLSRQIGWANKVLAALYSQIETLIALVARGDDVDREEYRQVQRKLREQIFDTRSGLKVEAAGDVNLSGDLVGRDKKETV